MYLFFFFFQVQPSQHQIAKSPKSPKSNAVDDLLDIFEPSTITSSASLDAGLFGLPPKLESKSVDGSMLDVFGEISVSGEFYSALSPFFTPPFKIQL